MTEIETVTACAKIINEGINIRRNGGVNPYQANTLKHFLSATGWLQEDLRIALMKASPSYAAGQHACGQGLETVR